MSPEEAKKILGAKGKFPPEIVKQAAAVFLADRQSKDPLIQFKPGPTQKRFLESKTRHRMLNSPNRGGKTSAVAYLIASCALRRNPVWSTKIPGTYVIFAPHRDQIVDPWAKKLLVNSELRGPAELFPMIPANAIEKIHKSYGGGAPYPKLIELKNGNKIWTGVSGTGDSWEGLEGKGTILGVALDESAATQNLINECLVRLLDANSHPQVRADCGGGWLAWGATETKVKDAYTWFQQKCADPDNKSFEIFNIAPDENKAIDPAERELYRNILDADDFESRMMGQGGARDKLLVFPQFDPELHVAKTDYVPTDYDTIYVGYDPGSHVSGFVFCAFNEKSPNVCRVFAAAEIKRASIEQEVAMVKRIVRGRKIELVVYDQAARKIEKIAMGTTVAKQFRMEMEKQGVKSIRGYAYGRSRYEASVPIVRAKFLANEIQINPSAESGCRILTNQLKLQRFSDSSGILKESNIVAGNDHAVDSFRYLLSACPVYTKRQHNPPEPQYINAAMVAGDVPIHLSEQEARIAEQFRRSKIIAKQSLYGNDQWRVIA